MADPRFFKKADPISLVDLADKVGAVIPEGSDGSLILNDVAALSDAAGNHVSFLDNAKYKNDFCETKAGACFVSDDMAALAPQGCIPLISQSPYKSYALAAQYFYPQEVPESDISEAAHIHPSATIGQGVQIEAGVIIAAGVTVGDGSWICAGACIGKNVEIGQHCRIGENAVVSHAILGDYVRLYRGVCVGQDGFGFAIDPAGHVKVPQLGRVLIGNHVEIGANTTIDRGAGPDTIIGDGCWIDNLVQIGHNVKLGRGCVIVSQVGISGSTEFGDFVVAAGQVGVAGHLKIGTGARIAAKSGVIGDIPAGEDYMGYPAVPRKKFLRQMATLSRLIKPKK